MKFATQHYTQDLRRYYRMPAVQVSLTLVLSFFVIALFIGFALRPTIVSIVTLKKTIEESNKTSQLLSAKVKSLQLVATQLDELKPILPSINVYIPNNGARYSPFAMNIETLANQIGVQLDSESMGPTLLFSRILSPFTPSKKQVVVALPFTIRVSGNYEKVLSFLNKLLLTGRIVIVESVTITREVSSEVEGSMVALNLSGNAYYLADENQLKKVMTDMSGEQ